MSIKINDKQYWTEFYSKNSNIPKVPSPFATYLIESKIINHPDRLIELGCGNGRDSIYFASHDIEVTAIDQCENTTTMLNKMDKINSFAHDFTNLAHQLNEIDVIYSRFTLHSINEVDQDRTLQWAYDAIVEGGLFCIEARTLKDPICGKGIDKGNNVWFYNNHHRRFIDAQDFKRKLIEIGFKIISFEEKNDLAKYKDDNPVVLRAIVLKLK